jgi:hypothetical protein
MFCMGDKENPAMLREDSLAHLRRAGPHNQGSGYLLESRKGRFSVLVFDRIKDDLRIY